MCVCVRVSAIVSELAPNVTQRRWTETGRAPMGWVSLGLTSPAHWILAWSVHRRNVLVAMIKKMGSYQDIKVPRDLLKFDSKLT